VIIEESVVDVPFLCFKGFKMLKDMCSSCLATSACPFSLQPGQSDIVIDLDVT